MKKIFSFALALVMLFTMQAVSVFANDVISVTTNGQAVTFTDQAPVIVDGRTLVPVAGVFQALGFETAWDATTQQVTVTRANTVIVITIGSDTFTTNGVVHNLDVPAQIIGGRTMLPIAAVVSSAGYNVSWNGETRTVVITGGATQPEPELSIGTPLAPPGFADAVEPDWVEAEEENEEWLEVEQEDADLDDETEEEPVAEAAAQGFEGTWLWDVTGVPYYTFEANGQGTMAGSPIFWAAQNGILSICNTPAICGSIRSCPVTMNWYYTFDGNELNLQSTTTAFNFTYIRQ